MEDLLTVKEVAERLGVTTNRIRQMISAGDLKAQKVGEENLIAESEISRAEKLAEQKIEKSTPPAINELAALKISIERMEEGHLREIAVTQYESKLKQLAEMYPGQDLNEMTKLVEAEAKKIKQSEKKS
jgi:excisionase family DNA binding protein